MSGDWIKIRCELPTSPNLVRISSALKADRLRTLGGLVSALCLADMHAECRNGDGWLDGYDEKLLDDFVGLEGLTAAMVSIGWIKVEPQAIVFINYEAHNGRSAKRRAQDQKRQKNVRFLSASKADVLRTREEKRREENIKDKKTSTSLSQKNSKIKNSKIQKTGDQEKKPSGPEPQQPEKPATRKTRFPKGWEFTPDLRRPAVEFWKKYGREDLDPVLEFVKFENHHVAHGSTMADWPAAWRTWYSNAVKFNPPSVRGPAGSGKTEAERAKTDEFAAESKRRFDAEQARQAAAEKAREHLFR